MPTKDDLKYFQAMPLYLKIAFSKQRMREWVQRFGSNGVYVSFSGGKDSTVLADLYAQFCKEFGYEMWLAFVNTGLEYPEIQKFVKWYAEHLQDKYEIVVHLEVLRPKMRFDEVIKKYGYPLISKSVSNCVAGAKKGQQSRINLLNGLDCDGSDRKSKFSQLKYRPLLDVDFEVSDMCCDVMKKSPSYIYQRKTGKMPILATMAQESMLREKNWIKNGCNAFEAKHPQSAPMSFWTEQDVLQYIKQYEVPIANVYGDVVEEDNDGCEYTETLFGDACGELRTTGCDRTGCIFCAFGCHLEKEPSRFQRLKQTHPRQYEYCIGGGEYVDGVWQPNRQGLGMGHVFDELNKIYGDGFIKY